MTRKTWTHLTLALTLILTLTVPALAATVDVEVGAGAVTFTPDGAHGGQLTVTGPDDFVYEALFAAGEIFSFNAADATGDGLYKWEVRFGSDALSQNDNERGLGTSAADVSSGAFSIAGGSLVEPDVREGGLAEKLVHAEDVKIQGSLCVGVDCTSSENFGFDTIRLKENNLRIKFEDTSTGSFPGNDWQLVANDSSNGGLNRFSIEDVTGGKTPFTVEAGAPSNSLYVDSAGKVGVGTGNPASGIEIHVKDGDSPTLRLEQDGSSGFTAQTWDVAGNEANFFVRDVTHGSKLPFRIQPGSGNDNALYIASDGDIGMGTTSPAAPLHVKESTGAAVTAMQLTNNNQVNFVMENTGTGGESWFFASNNDGSFSVSQIGTGVNELILNGSGDLTIAGTLYTKTGNTCAGGCDRVFQPGYDLPSIEEHAAAMWTNSYLPAVGPTAENPDAPFDVTAKTAGILNELEKAHIYIEQLHETLKQLNERVEQLEATNAQ